MFTSAPFSVWRGPILFAYAQQVHFFSSVCYRVPTPIFYCTTFFPVSVWTGPNSVLSAHQCTTFCKCLPGGSTLVCALPLHLFYLEELILFACANSAPCLLCLPRSQLLCAPCLSVSVLIGPNFVLVLTSAPRLRVSA